MLQLTQQVDQEIQAPYKFHPVQVQIQVFGKTQKINKNYCARIYLQGLKQGTIKEPT